MLRGMEPGRGVALIISECQRGVIEPGLTDFPTLAEQVEKRAIIPRIANLAAAFRAAGLPVIHAHVAHQPDYADLPITNLIMARSKKRGGMKLGSDEAQSVAGVAPQPGDVVFSRGYALVGFHGTDMDTRLRHMGIQTLVFSGVSTNVAISGMALAASDYGYQSIVVEDCIAGATAESHDFILANLLPLYSTIVSSQQVLDTLKRR